jgi:chemotaxis methyl-accepting protein methylase
MYTSLFRKGTYLPAVLDLAAARAEEPETLSVYSVGCSSGAEADSILALHDINNYPGKIALCGFDINPMALEYAERGFHAAELSAEQVDELAGAGFDIMELELLGTELEYPTVHLVSSKKLRARHDIKFIEHDFRKPYKDKGKADLVLANNLLYHIRKKSHALRMVYNLCELLSDTGVISFGSTFFRGNKWRPKLSLEWTGEPLSLMANRFGLELLISVETYKEKVPVAFGRPMAT